MDVAESADIAHVVIPGMGLVWINVMKATKEILVDKVYIV